jgi:hypothetical protein
LTQIEDKDFIFYRSPKTGEIVVKVALIDGDIWSTYKGMSLIFNTTRQNIEKHVKKIFSSGELDKNSVCNQKLHTALDGKTYKTTVFSLDVIIAVGYRVNSFEATQFRIWATKILKEYLTKGFVLDDDRLKQGKEIFGKDYFDELLERIKEIRASERRFYQKITDLYRDASSDYNKDAPETRKFYQIVQNKLLYAVTKSTAAEIIKSRADSESDNMGLTTWKGQKQDKKIITSDITVAKNYLSEDELKQLNNIVSMFLDYAQGLVSRQIVMPMGEWAKTLDDFITFNRYDVLDNAGQVTKKSADNFAKSQYDKFRVRQDLEHLSDFDKTIIEIKQTGRAPKSRFSEFIEEAEVEDEPKEPLSTFNKSLKTALEFNPKDK